MPGTVNYCIAFRTLVIALFPGLALAKDDEFANNLFSDLAPLLALFGERVAQQFLSEAITEWSDSILFAMAPIGIITTVIGAIRVGGPGWLKALVGRAKESIAVAELELLSSTSSDVCEMWNGAAVVRIMGSPSILQLVHIVDGQDDKLHVLEDGNFRAGMDIPFFLFFLILFCILLFLFLFLSLFLFLFLFLFLSPPPPFFSFFLFSY